MDSHPYCRSQKQKIIDLKKKVALLRSEPPMALKKTTKKTLEDDLKKMKKKEEKRLTDECRKVRDGTNLTPPNTYRNIEAIARGYNVFYGSPFTKDDRGPGNYLFALDWSKMRYHSSGRVSPMET